MINSLIHGITPQTLSIVNNDPRAYGRAGIVGDSVLFVSGSRSTILIKRTSSDYGWQDARDGDYVLPDTAAQALGLFGFTPTAMYRPGRSLNLARDLIGSANLTHATAGAVAQQTVERFTGFYSQSAGQKLTADVMDPGSSSFWVGVVFAIPYVQATTGLLTRFDASANGWGLYFLSAGSTLLWRLKDASAHAVSTQFAVPVLNPSADADTLYLAQATADRTGHLANLRLSKRGSAPDTKVDGSIATITDTLSVAAQTAGFGANNGVNHGAFAAWGAYYVGAEVETGQTFMAAIEAAMGFAA